MQAQHTAFAPAPTTGNSATSNAGTSGARRASDIVAPTLAAIVKGLVAVRAEIHALHAVEATLLALGDSIAEEVAVREHHTDHGESEHRTLAAEFAAAVHESDRTMAGRITRAVTLVQDFPDVHHALQKGRISQTHATLITDAGMIITDDTARDRYTTAALEIAQVETPGRVRSLVKELAERFANRTLDQRHQEARTCRMVRVVELGDGMADLTATLPAVYAYGIKDRLNQMARGIKQHEQALADQAKKSGQPGQSGQSGQSGSPAGSGSRASSGASFTAANGPDGTGMPGTSDPASDASTPDDATESQPTPRIVRSMDQIRADLLTDMLLATDPNNAALSGFTGITGLRARVQVIVPKERLGTSETGVPSGPTSGSASTTESASETNSASEPESEPGSATDGAAGTSPSTSTDTDTDTDTDSDSDCDCDRDAHFGTPADPDTSTNNGTGTPSSAPAPAPAPAPATLAGYGPIDTDTARQLAGHATHWENITINPDTGTVLSVDTYRPNTKLKQFLRARDLHCRFPGCHTPTVRCDIDHTVDAAHGGPTTSTNLAHLCRRHHTLKHHSKWSVVQATDGTLTWTSPLGTPYTERPPSTVRFRPVSISDPPRSSAPPSPPSPPSAPSPPPPAPPPPAHRAERDSCPF